MAHEALVEAYWKPVYKYLRLKWQLSPMRPPTRRKSSFSRSWRATWWAATTPRRARFRTYLRLCLDGFVANQQKAERRIKRGGGMTTVPLDFTTAEGELVRIEPSIPADVDDLFYCEWVRALFDRAVADLRADAETRNRQVMFEVFVRYDLADAGRIAPDLRRDRSSPRPDHDHGHQPPCRDAPTVPRYRAGSPS